MKDMYRNSNTEDDAYVYDMPTDEEQTLISDAFALRETIAADMDAEWLKLRRTSVCRRFRLRAVFVAAAVAAGIALLAVLSLPRGGGMEPVAVITRQNMECGVSLTDAAGHKYDIDTAGVTFAGKPAAAARSTMMLMATSRGRDCHFTLPDGTRVWLNGESELRFPSRFTGRCREVKLSGEAFFEVMPDRAHPFVVTSDYYSATVLGTSFDARAYSASDASVTLVEGSVKVSPAIGADNLILTPGHSVTFGASGAMTVAEVDTYPCIQRKEGYFYFDRASMLDIMIELGRWYNKTVVFEDAAAMSTMLHFVASRNDSLDTVLKYLGELDNVEIEYTKDDITIK